MENIVDETRQLNEINASKGRGHITYRLVHLGKRMYRVAFPISEDDVEVAAEGVMSYFYDGSCRYPVALTEDGMVYVLGTKHKVQTDGAFKVVSRDTSVLAVGTHGLLLWDYGSGGFADIHRHGDRITDGELLGEDIIMLISDGNVYIGAKRLSQSAKISSEMVHYVRRASSGQFITSTGFIYKGVHYEYGGSPKNVVTMSNGDVMVLYNGELFGTRLQWDNEEDFSVRIPFFEHERYIHDIKTVGDVLLGEDAEGILGIEATI